MFPNKVPEIPRGITPLRHSKKKNGGAFWGGGGALFHGSDNGFDTAYSTLLAHNICPGYVSLINEFGIFVLSANSVLGCLP